MDSNVISLDNGKYVQQYDITDFCMMQIHRSNISKLGLDPNRLLSDVDYCIHNGIKILNGFKYLSSYDSRWWSRYNSGDPQKRYEYESYIKKHYSKIVNTVPKVYKVISKYEATPALHPYSDIVEASL